MFEVRVISHFSAAHYLREYKGKCESLHGHNWKVEAVVVSSTLDSRQMVMDFSDLKHILNDVLSVFDHRCLNDLSCFNERNTTSERIAEYIYRELALRLKDFFKTRNIEGIALKEVAVWEQDNSCAVYRP